MIESVPLIQNANDAQQINASIIAMKKASKELDEKILKLNNLNKELDKRIAVLNNGLAQEITDRENADSAEVTNRNTAITNAVNALDVASVGGSGKYISAISETDGKISAIVSDLTSVIESGNNQPATSNAVYGASPVLIGQMQEGASNVTDGTEFVSSYASDNGFNETGFKNQPFKRKFVKVWNYIKSKISSWMDSTPTSESSAPITSGGVFSALYGSNIASDVFTVTASWIANHTTDIRRLGNFLVCNIFVQVTTAQTLSSATKIATLSIKPPSNIRALGAVESTGEVIKAEINPQGELTVAPFSGSVSVSGYIRFESIIFAIATS